MMCELVLGRRGFLGGLVCAPAVVRASSLMRVVRVPVLFDGFDSDVPWVVKFSQERLWYSAGDVALTRYSGWSIGRCIDGGLEMRCLDEALDYTNFWGGLR